MVVFGALFYKDSPASKITTIPSCKHQERALFAYCPICGVKTKDLVKYEWRQPLYNIQQSWSQQWHGIVWGDYEFQVKESYEYFCVYTNPKLDDGPESDMEIVPFHMDKARNFDERTCTLVIEHLLNRYDIPLAWLARPIGWLYSSSSSGRYLATRDGPGIG